MVTSCTSHSSWHRRQIARLDEPTLGLDILYRKQFYDSLLNDYFDRTRTIVVTTHQVEDVEHVLTDLMFIHRGRVVLSCSMEEFESRYLELTVVPEKLPAARALKPMHERQILGRSILLFSNTPREQLAALGDLRTPSIADVFVAVIGTIRADHKEPLYESSIEYRAEFPERDAAPPTMSVTQPFYWSVRRELLEHRSIYAARSPSQESSCSASSSFLPFLPHTVRTLSSLDSIASARCPRAAL